MSNLFLAPHKTVLNPKKINLGTQILNKLLMQTLQCVAGFEERQAAVVDWHHKRCLWKSSSIIFSYFHGGLQIRSVTRLGKKSPLWKKN